MNEEQSIIEACRQLTITLPDGTPVPRLGQGTWHMGEQPGKADAETAALRRGIELGMTLIDTAEMYADGGAESVVGRAIHGIPRESLFLVSKVYPHNAGRRNIFRSCDASLKRLGVDRLDLYLLHWRGGVPLAETVACMQELVAAGKIAQWGVSNFDVDDMQELWQVPGGKQCGVNQVLYHLGSRGIEYDLMPWQRERGVPIMAYCPLAQAGRLRSGLLQHPAVGAVAARHSATPAQVLLAFALHDPLVIAIPKAASEQHAQENAAAAGIALTPQDMAELSAAFPAPHRKQPLNMC